MNELNVPSKMQIDALIDEASVLLDKKLTCIDMLEGARNNLIREIERINDVYSDMQEYSRHYLNGVINEDERRDKLSELLGELRIPVKELQIKLGSDNKTEIDTYSVPTEDDLLDFKYYVEQFIILINNKISKMKDLMENEALITEEEVTMIEDMLL